MTDEETIRCNFCGKEYAADATNCPSCNFPTPGMTPAATVNNRRIDSKQVLLVGGIAALALTVAIVLSVVLTGGEDDPVAEGPGSSTSGNASTRPQAWSASVNGAISSQVTLPDALVVSTSDSLRRIDADGSDAWITSLTADANVVAESADGSYVLTEGIGEPGVGAYDVDSGEQRWLLGGLSYVAAVPSGAIVRAGDGPFGLVDNDGGLAWRVETNQQSALPEAGEDPEVVFVRTGATVVSLDIETGEQRWSKDTSFNVGGNPLPMAATNDMVVLGGPGQVAAFDAESGDRLWAIDGNGSPPQIQQFGPDLVAVAFDADSDTVLFDATGEKVTLTGESRSALDISTFEVDGTPYAADLRNATVYDASGSRVGTYPVGTLTPAPDGYFVTAADIAMHFTLGATSADYTVPAPSGSTVAPLNNRVVVVAGSNARGY